LQSMYIENQSGKKLAAYQCLPEADLRLLLVICHGFRGAKENGGRIFTFAERLNKLGIGVVAFDFSGSGQSEGEFSTLTLSRQAADLQSVIDELHARYKLPMVLLGRSFGGTTVIAGGAADERIRAYILWSTPIFLEKTFAAMIPEEYKSLQTGQIAHIHDAAGSYDLGSDFIRDFACHDMEGYLKAMHSKPVLIIHAEDDEIVPAENAVYMANQLEKSKLFLIEQAGHRFLQKIEQREDLTIKWLEKLIEEQ